MAGRGNEKMTAKTPSDRPNANEAEKLFDELVSKQSEEFLQQDLIPPEPSLMEWCRRLLLKIFSRNRS